ncbi:hypothetical protein FG386_002290 [Cryptosporidium ryanae]|uniref:uncharacterized protein n=1 Tax=Cryptosporidium ryanae TaxID=515981 RepID=UPI00351A75CC|nr:hypothetical protein FG386_002290 [Cryptosporidium ryanae]
MPSERKGLLFCLGCISFIPGVKNKLVNNMSFHPPTVKGYKYSKQYNKVLLYDHNRNKYVTMNEVMRNMVKLVPGRSQVRVKFMTINSTDVFYYINNASKLTIIYSHSNATDIGYLFGHLLDLAYSANVNIISYEYSGYGQSKGTPSENSIYEDINKVLDYSVNKLKLKPDSIVLYGQSIGSAPTIHLASKCNSMNLGGIIVHSGIKSAVSVICDSKTNVTLPWYDAFKNLDKIQKVNCPVFVIHGTGDTIIPFNHGEMLYKLAPNKFTPWFVNGANHCNIEVNWRGELVVRIKRFLMFVSSNTHNSLNNKIPIKGTVDNDDLQTISRVSTISSQGFERIDLNDLSDEDDYDDFEDYIVPNKPINSDNEARVMDNDSSLNYINGSNKSNFKQYSDHKINNRINEYVCYNVNTGINYQLYG